MGVTSIKGSRQGLTLAEGSCVARHTGIQVMDRAVEILECFTKDHPSRSAQEIHCLTGIPRSTVYRILDALVKLDLCS